MAIKQGIWKMGTIPQKLTTVPLDNESLLEEQVCQDISILLNGSIPSRVIRLSGKLACLATRIRFAPHGHPSGDIL
ncbi:hypothetical protein [Endozoicomonas sp. YOMI1]|uniref:hypothetical protein n=1 Tax=Endozoicomonas sp. YOMI1 TaxID=2828739 RepID=UPI002148E445|nr:hypothetical protein [Endozoicomonas sp. YOMI1]